MSVLLVQGDARSIPLADRSVQCAVTSPPYWGLRDYGVAGQIGLEPTLAEYLRAMVEVFREVRRVLRDDGTVWLNMGDGYAQQEIRFRNGKGRRVSHGLKPKDLLMQPHRLAIALQEAGWYVRSDIVWAKPNPMPESVTDRPTKSHEYIFLLSKSERYYFDQEAVREPMAEASAGRYAYGFGGAKNAALIGMGMRTRVVGEREAPAGRNLRSVWTMTTRACKEAHFATFPIDLPLRCIKAGTSEKGCCPTCGAPWKRVVERVPTGGMQKMADGWDTGAGGHGSVHRDGRQAGESGNPVTRTVTTHWLPTCKCPAHEPVPCIVLDPFGGACTTAMAASELGRHCVIMERKPDYLAIGRKRLANHRPRGVKVRKARELKPEKTLWG